MKIGTILKRIAAFLLAFILGVTITDATSFAKAKAKPKLSDTSLTMWTNQSNDIRMEYASSKVTWKSSDKRIVKIAKISGKYNQSVSLETGNKSGSCTIKAKMKNKTYCCRVTVRKGDIEKAYSGKKSKTVLVKVMQNKHSVVVRYKMCAAEHKNCKCPPASYGPEIQLEKYTDGKWSEVPMDVYVMFPCVMYNIPPKTSITKEVHLENYYDISKLTKGSYRLNVNVFYPDTKSPYVKFKLK